MIICYAVFSLSMARKMTICVFERKKCFQTMGPHFTPVFLCWAIGEFSEKMQGVLTRLFNVEYRWTLRAQIHLCRLS